MAYADGYLGQNIGKLGFGLMRLPGTQDGGDPDIEQMITMVDAFMDAGFTYFDTAYVYDAGKSEAAAKTALVDRYPRESFQLATKLNAWLGSPSEDEAKRQLEISLERTGAGYFDYYLLHAIQGDNHELYDKYGLWDFVQQKRDEGLIRNWGFSFHSTSTLLRQVLDSHPKPDFVQLQINYADWESPSICSRENYEICAERGIPVIVMEPLRGGALVNPPGAVGEILQNANPAASLASWGIRFAASLPGIITVLSGMSNLEQMEDNLSYMRDFKPLDDAELAAVNAAQEALSAIEQVPCTDCRYCMPDCPVNMRIPAIFNAMNRRIVFNIQGQADFAYNNATVEVKASECLKCGNCEAACPQGIEIISWLERAAEIFE